MIIKRAFFNRKAVDVARDLLGNILVRKFDDGKIKEYRIVETEAYSSNDEASHSYNGITKRNEVMFGEPGFTYIYLCYGFYYMLNITAEKKGVGGAVLIRALEPLDEEDLLQIKQANNLLTNGPGKLTKYLNISIKENKTDVCNKNNSIFVKQITNKNFEIEEAPRIGIKIGLDKFWRFYIKNNIYVSQKKKEI